MGRPESDSFLFWDFGTRIISLVARSCESRQDGFMMT